MSRKKPKIDREEMDAPTGRSEQKEQKREEYDAFGFMKDKKQIGAVAGAFLIFGFFISWFVNPPLTALIVGEGTLASSAFQDGVGQDTVDYINENMLPDGLTASLENVTAESGLYLVNIKINSPQGSQDFVSYVSPDGKFLFVQTIDMTVEVPKLPEEPEQNQQESTEVPKSDRPVANVFVMAYCPFGLQAEKAVIPVMELLGDKADININYVHYVMHGKEEIDQNTRQYCIQKEQPEKFAAYLRCFVQSDDHTKCVADACVDKTKLDACMAAADQEFNITGLYEQGSTAYLVDAELSQLYGIGGSPGFVINGQTITSSNARCEQDSDCKAYERCREVQQDVKICMFERSPELVKQAICSAFNTPPEECQQELSTSPAAPGIGAMEGGTGSQGMC